jgi:hypothetical protein
VEKYYMAAFKKKTKSKEKGVIRVPQPLDLNYGDSLALVASYLDAGKRTCNRIMKTSEIRVYARMLEWTLEYFYNGYRQGAKHIITSVLSTFGGYSYYGWIPASLSSSVDCGDNMEMDDNNSDEELLLENVVEEPELLNTKCRKADRVSLKRPSDRQLHVFLERSKIVLNIGIQPSSSSSSSAEIKTITSTIVDNTNSSLQRSRVLGNSIESHMDQMIDTFKSQNRTNPDPYTEISINNNGDTPRRVTGVLKRSANKITTSTEEEGARSDEKEDLIDVESKPKKQRTDGLFDQIDTPVLLSVQITPRTIVKPLGLTKTPSIRTHLLLKKRT